MNNVITAFKEHKVFKHNRPWDVNTLTFPADLITPPHYADTIEVLLCCNVTGDIYIGGQKSVLGGKQVFYIPPRVVHSVFYKNNNGFVKVLKINIEQLKVMLNIEEFLKYKGKNFLCLPTHIPCFEEVSTIADTFHNSNNIFEICQCILHLFDLLIYYCDTSDFDTIKNKWIPKIKELCEKEHITIVMTTHDTGLMEIGDKFDALSPFSEGRHLRCCCFCNIVHN